MIGGRGEGRRHKTETEVKFVAGWIDLEVGVAQVRTRFLKKSVRSSRWRGLSGKGLCTTRFAKYVCTALQHIHVHKQEASVQTPIPCRCAWLAHNVKDKAQCRFQCKQWLFWPVAYVDAYNRCTFYNTTVDIVIQPVIQPVGIYGTTVQPVQ